MDHRLPSMDNKLTLVALGVLVVAGVGFAYSAGMSRDALWGLLGNLIGALIAIAAAVWIEDRKRQMQATRTKRFILRSIIGARQVLVDWKQLEVAADDERFASYRTLGERFCEIVARIDAARQVIDPDSLDELQLLYRLHATFQRIRDRYFMPVLEGMDEEQACQFILKESPNAIRDRALWILSEAGYGE